MKPGFDASTAVLPSATSVAMGSGALPEQSSEYEYTVLGASSCNAGSNPIASASECSRAAHTLQLPFGGEQSDGGAFRSCYSFEGAVYWNALADRAWADVAQVCIGASGVEMILNTNGCSSKSSSISTPDQCKTAAAQSNRTFGGVQRDSGAPLGCVYIENREISWNTAGGPWSDIGLVCAKQ
jgi:hypothetical protein